MRLVLQRVSEAEVTVEGEVVATIGPGLLVLAGVAPTDQSIDARAAAEKLAVIRLFADDDGHMNRSIVDTGGEILVVSQFTLLADVRRGRRPSFTGAATPELAAPLIEALAEHLIEIGIPTQTGRFGARMGVSLVNDGPVTVVLEFSEGRLI
ncbi:MAG TPA: D-aminoacyl-tRNA deacylase [Acidimicrobiia bacterium]